MKQILHIFAKDTRRFWPEILISLAITAAFVCLCPYQWTTVNDEHSSMLRSLSYLLAVLVPVSWWILISRVVHAERLVGDTQFWITRPYTWKTLLAAKLLFLLTFLYLPFFIAQNTLLAEAGFSVSAQLPGLLFILLLATGFIVLPFAALASITSSFAHMTLTILGVVLSFIALITLAAFLYNGQQGSMGLSSHLPSRLCFALAVVGLCAAIELQYGLRRLWLTRTVLIALPFLLAAAAYLASQYNQSQVDRVYSPSTPQAAPAHFAYTPEAQGHGSSSYESPHNSTVRIRVPLTEFGVANGYAILPDGYRAEITAPDGSHWRSAWLPTEGVYLADAEPFATYLMIPLDIYRKFQNQPLRLHLDLALTQAQAGNTTTIPLPTHSFSVPDFGICSPQNDQNPSGDAMGIRCIAPLRNPPSTYITTRWSNAPCSAPQTAPDPGVIGTVWVGSLDREPATFGISPVSQPQINLSNSQSGSDDNSRPRFLCPGTPVTFTHYNTIRRAQTSVEVQNFHLPSITVVGNRITVTQ